MNDNQLGPDFFSGIPLVVVPARQKKDLEAQLKQMGVQSMTGRQRRGLCQIRPLYKSASSSMSAPLQTRGQRRIRKKTQKGKSRLFVS
jgi:hypothetical protein